MFSPDVGIGDWIFEDLNGDGSLSTAIYPDGDHVVLADEDPRYEFGINFNAAYRGFDFTMFWQGVFQQAHQQAYGIVVDLIDKTLRHHRHGERHKHSCSIPNVTLHKV